MKKYISVLFSLFLPLAVIAQTPIKIKQGPTRHGPAKGSLLIIGGGTLTPDLWSKFTELAGGKDKANIVVITAASGDSAAFQKGSVELIRKQTGIKQVTLLHTSSLQEANSEKFIEPLRKATGVYFTGGRQWRIADSYLNTLTHQAFQEVLERGGVIAGSSAGATIQGSFLWRGDTRGAHILIGDHTQGLGFLKNSVIDQHLLKRNRQFDLVEFVRQTPDLIGLGLDESTGVLVQSDTLQVIGKSFVAIYDYNTITGKGEAHVKNNDEDYQAANGPFILLSAGQKYDLYNRKVIRKPRAPRTTEPAASQK